jgi:hypothetical protein
MENPEEGAERFENDDDEEEDEEENKVYWMEMEMANYVGFQINLKTHFGDYLCGKILGVKDSGLLLADKKDNRMYCDLQCIATYCIFNKETKRFGRMKKPKAKNPKAKKLK